MKIHDNTLTQNSVSIQSAEYGMRAYTNSIRGRAQLESEAPDYLVAEIYKVWGDTPTVAATVFEIPQTEPQSSATDILGQQISALTLEVAMLKGGAV